MTLNQTTGETRAVLATAAGTSFYAPLINYEAQPLHVTPVPFVGSSISLRRPPQPKDAPSSAPLQHVSSNLSQKVLGDIAIGSGVTLTVTPFLTIVDKAIVQRAAGTHSLFSSIAESTTSMIRNPVAFVRNPAFLLMWSVYAATYSTANSLKTIVEHKDFLARKQREEQRWFSIDDEQNSGSSSHFSVFIGTTAVNSTASLLKDRAYAKMFGTTGAAPKVPLITMGLWATRDCMVVYSSFILPDLTSQWLHETYPSIALQDAKRATQFSIPILTQFVAGPIQLLGLDFYNRPLASLSIWEAAADRARFLARGFVSVVTARIARIAPGYGIGGVLNAQWRDSYRDYLIEKEMKEIMVDGTDVQPETYRLVQDVAERHQESQD